MTRYTYSFFFCGKKKQRKGEKKKTHLFAIFLCPTSTFLTMSGGGKKNKKRKGGRKGGGKGRGEKVEGHVNLIKFHFHFFCDKGGRVRGREGKGEGGKEGKTHQEGHCVFAAGPLAKEKKKKKKEKKKGKGRKEGGGGT